MKISMNTFFPENSNNNSRETLSKKPSVEDVVLLLRQFSKLLELAESRKPELAIEILKLANILARYKEKTIDEVLEGLTLAQKKRPATKTLQSKISESQVQSLTLDQIESLLEKEDLDKSDLISIGVSRFGLSKSELLKTKKTSISEVIKTSISNLKAIDIIGKQASGKR
jgi:hypothetical protein